MEKGSVVVMNEKDNVATAVRDLEDGAKIQIENMGEIVVKNKIPFGHKIAIKEINLGSQVIKYGEAIGRACKEISVGEHTHVHNVEGCRGRGDQKGGQANG